MVVRDLQLFSSKQPLRFCCRFALLLPFLAVLCTVFVVRRDMASGVVLGKYFPGPYTGYLAVAAFRCCGQVRKLFSAR